MLIGRIKENEIYKEIERLETLISHYKCKKLKLLIYYYYIHLDKTVDLAKERLHLSFSRALSSKKTLASRFTN